MTVAQLVKKLADFPQDIQVVYRPCGSIHADDMEYLDIVDLHRQEGYEDRVIIGT